MNLSKHKVHVGMVCVLIAFGAAQLLQAQTETVLYSFTGSPDGANPAANLVRDSHGNLFGTTQQGGTVNTTNCPYGCGILFELATTGESTLYSFAGPNADGAVGGSSLARDPAGNFYGTTPGGTSAGGTVWQVSPDGALTILYTFTGSPDGGYPVAGLLLGHHGILYGTTQNGGTYGSGTVFKIAVEGSEKVLYSFQGYPNDGSEPSSSLIEDQLGNLYGTTFENGPGGCGTVFEVTLDGVEKILYSFTDGSDGGFPIGSLVRDAAGNLYGTTYGGGTYGAGTVFKVTPDGTETVIHGFTGGSDGGQPVSNLTLGRDGNLYGTTVYGGTCSSSVSGCGVVFKLTLDGSETVLHTFSDFPDGANPWAGLVWDSRGNLYGTTLNGGAAQKGTVFKVTP